VKKWQRLLAIVLAIAAAFALGSEVQDQLGFSFSLEGLDSVRQWVADLGWLGPVAFVSLVTFRLFIGLSSHVVLILGGLVFGAVEGTVWGSLGLLISALIVFFSARLLGDDWVRPRLGERYVALVARIQRAGAVPILAITAHPAGPLTPVNLAAGLVGLPVWKFTLAVALGAPIRAAVFSILGTAVLSLSPSQSIAIGVGLVSVFVLPLLIPSVRGWVFGVEEPEREE
jgi:uncharacterized membrane protein YdjX (TVP38/TMEM64 family)